jgi:hypothetical protein
VEELMLKRYIRVWENVYFECCWYQKMMRLGECVLIVI